MSDLVKVMAAKQDGKVVLWDRHPDHPDGEVFITGDGKSLTVAMTPRVQACINSGKLLLMQATPEPTPSIDPITVASTGTVGNEQPFDGYDDMTAMQIVEKISTISDDTDLDAIREYETANKNRSTVLKALE